MIDSFYILDTARVLVPFIIAFFVGIFSAPLLTHYLYKYKAWKKVAGRKALDGNEATEFAKLRATGETRAGTETKTPRMGGILIWGSVLITAFGCMLLGVFFGGIFSSLDFVNRGQTWLPLAALMFGAILGLINDIGDIVTREGFGLSRRVRLLLIAIASAGAAWWFYDRLGVSSVGIPFSNPFELGIFFIPFFILVTLAVYSSGVIDGIDGLAGGVFGIIFAIYAGIAFSQEQIALAAFSASVSGAIFAFLWFNIPPARFWMTETGSMALTLTLVVTAFSADVLGEGIGVSLLPIIAFPLLATLASVLIQVFSKRIFKKKFFRIAPVHHHFEAIGWPSYKVTMRYWIITILTGMLGLIIALMQ